MNFYRTFGVIDCELDDPQIELASWADRYNDVYNMSPDDRPGIDVIEDDYALDAYLADLMRKRQKKP